MAFYAKDEYIGDGSNDVFNITFPYLNRDLIKVYINDVEDPAITFLTDTQIKTSVVPEDGAIVQLARNTPLDRRVDFKNASLLDSQILDEDSMQMMHIVQEAYDGLENTMGRGTANDWNAEGLPISHVGDPVDPDDAMNMRSAMSYLEATEDAKDQAVVARDQAVVARSEAESAETGAEKWAEENEDVEVEPNQYSAFHWAKKAQAEAGSVIGMQVHDNTWHSEDFETTTGAQSKANTAETNANSYTDGAVRTDEEIQDVIGALVQAGANVSIDYDDVANTLTISSSFTNTQRSDEEIQDVVGALVQGGSNVTASYDDVSNTLTISATDTNTQRSDSEIQTAINGDGDHGSTAQHDYFTSGDAVSAIGGSKNDGGTGTSALWSASKISSVIPNGGQWASGRYIGNGGTNRTINVGFVPDIVIIAQNDLGQPYGEGIETFIFSNNHPVQNRYNSNIGARVYSSGFLVGDYSSTFSGNTDDSAYQWIAIKV